MGNKYQNDAKDLAYGLVKDAPHIAADLANIRSDLEGPKFLRALAFLGGIAMSAVASVGLIKFTDAIFNPWEYAMQVYML